VHGSHRVAGDRFQFAMPEVGIGFFPDVGATWFLPRLPGEIGTYCALTGDRLNAADGVAAGIATHRIASARFPDLAQALCGAVSVDAILAAFAEPAPSSPSPHSPSKTGVEKKASSVIAHRAAIDRLFAADSVEAIVGRLDAEAAAGGGDSAWAGEVAARMRTKAPLSLKIALAQMRRGREWTFAQCMQAEFRVVSRVAYGDDFYEGIRAVIIDKDNRPRWRPETLAEVTPQDVERHFAPLEAELALP
jgi:enoyl-CoA hydratase